MCYSITCTLKCKSQLSYFPFRLYKNLTGHLDQYNSLYVDKDDRSYVQVAVVYTSVTLFQKLTNFLIHHHFIFLSFDDISDILPLLDNCCCLSAACTSSVLEDDESLLPKMISNVYHLNQLQNDIAASMMSKLKQIQPISCMIFTFINVQESVSSIL